MDAATDVAGATAAVTAPLRATHEGFLADIAPTLAFYWRHGLPMSSSWTNRGASRSESGCYVGQLPFMGRSQGSSDRRGGGRGGDSGFGIQPQPPEVTRNAPKYGRQVADHRDTPSAWRWNLWKSGAVGEAQKP